MGSLVLSSRFLKSNFKFILLVNHHGQFMKRKEANLEIRNSGKVRVFIFPDFMSSKLWVHELALTLAEETDIFLVLSSREG